MKLRRLRVRRMPGIDDGFDLGGLSDGTNLIVGPNGSGKTTLCRAYRAALWPGTESDEAIAVEAELQDDSGRWIVRRESSRTRWQRDGEEAEPPVLPSANAAHCFTLGFRDLIADRHPTDETVAHEIRRQMAGGFDVSRVLEQEFALKQRHGLAEDAALRDRMREVGRIKAEQSDLADREERLRDLEDELKQAQAAAARLESLETAATLRRTRDELESIRRRLEEFPEVVARMAGDEMRRVEELDVEETSLLSELSRCRAEIEQAENTAAQQRLPYGPLDEVVLNGWAARVRQLQQHATDLATARRLADEARARRDEAARGLDPDRDAGFEPVIDGKTLRAIESFLDRATAARSDRKRLDAVRRVLAGKAAETPDRDLDQGVRSLQAWQAAHARQQAMGPRRGFLILGVALVVAAAVTWWLGEASAAVALAVAGALTLLLMLLASTSGKGKADADASRREFESLGLDAPESWAPDSVQQRLRLLQRQQADAAFRDRELQRLEELEPVDAELRQREEALAADRQRLRQQVGIDAGQGDLDLARVARALSAYQDASIDHRKAQASQQQAEHEQAKLLGEIDRFVTGHGSAAPDDAAAAAATVDALRGRSLKLRDARDRRRREQGLCEDVEGRLVALRDRREGIFVGLGLAAGDKGGLRDWLARRELRHSLDADLEQRRRTIGELEERLSDRPELRDLPAEEIARRIIESEALAARQEQLIEERVTTREAVSRARRAKVLETAKARVAKARDALEVRLDEALYKTAGRFLLEDVTTQFDRQSRPEILARAGDLFERFTHHRYELKIDTGTERPSYRAVETETGVGKSLAALSDATRVQLLLAARLAFASQVDRQAGLPLFLDEVLTTTDPERFVAVVQSLLVFAAEEGRQIFYLTANPADVVQWNRVLQREGLGPVTSTDLAALRGMASGVSTRSDLDVPPLLEVPSPAGKDAVTYGDLLKVPRVDLLRPPEALHLFHLLRDELELLYVLLVSRIRTVGQWRRLADGGGGATLVGSDAAARISALADVAEAFFDASRVGRCRPVDIGVLRDAGLTELWVDKLESLLDELDGDPARFLEALEASREDARTKGFRNSVRDRLRQHLTQHGYLDERDPLDEAAIHSRVQVSVAVHVEKGLIRAEQVAARVHELQYQGCARA